MREKIRNLFRIFLGNCGGSVEKRSNNNKSVPPSLPRIEEARAMYTPHSGFQMVNENMKGMSGKEKCCWGVHWFSIDICERAKDLPHHLPNVTKSVFFGLFIIWLESYLHSSLQFQVQVLKFPKLTWMVGPKPPKPESGHLGRPSPPPLLFNFLCTYTYPAWVSFKNNLCFCPCFLGFHCIPSLGYNFPSM